jgi:MFS family permease
MVADLSDTAASTQQFPPASAAWWAVAVFSGAALLSYTDRQILTLLVDPLRHDLRISDTQFSVLQGAAFAVLYSIVGLPLGRIADLVPRKRLLLLAVGTWSLGTAACGFAASFDQLLAARLLVGIGEAAFGPAAMSLIADFFPLQRRATAIGVFFIGMLVGSGAGIAIGGTLLGLARRGAFATVPIVRSLAPWRSVLALAGIAGVGIFLLLLTVREPGQRRFSWRNLRAHTGLAAAMRPFIERSTLLLPLYAALAAANIVDYSLLTWTPALLARRFAYSPLDIAATLGTVAMIATLAGTPAGGALTDWCTRRWGSRSRMTLTLAVTPLGLLAAPVGILGTGPQTLIAAGCWMLISAVIAVAGIATMLDLLPTESRGLATATIGFTNTIVGLGIGPSLVALAADHVYGGATAVGPAMSTVITPAILASCGFFFVAYRRSRLHQERSPLRTAG